MAMSVPRGLSVMGKRGDTFGVVFADPPYGRGWVDKTIEQILANNVLSPNGTIVMEHAPDECPSRGLGKLITLKQKTYGDTAISFLGYETL
jgi:16S rRNA G966 N2-methylase RsmD